MFPEVLAALDAAAGNAGRDPAGAEVQAAAFEVVALVGVQLRWPFAGAASCLANGMNRVDGGGERHAVVPVGSRQNEGERQASPIHHDVALGAGLSTIRRVRPCRVTPFLAGTDEASSEARDQSIRPARFRRSSMWR